MKNLEPSTRHKLLVAFIFLACLSVVTGAVSLTISLNAITSKNHQFCEVITPVIQTLKPQVSKNPAAIADPKLRAQARQLADWYVRYQHLSNHLGC